ncbi:hypothetical protein Tco_0240806 [Tanacetum coccineum]
MREKSMKENVDYDYCDIETKNVELENSVAKMLSENKRLCKEINHVKQVFKDHFYSIKKTCVCTKEHSDSLIDKPNLKSAENEDLKSQIQEKVFVITSLKKDLRKLKGKETVDSAAQIPSATIIVSGMFKLDLDPLAPRLLQNREAHIDYLKYTQEHADILWGIVEQAKLKQPLDNALDFAYNRNMNSTQSQQKALDDALVTPTDRLEFGKCNMRLKADIKPKEATFQVVLDVLTLTPFNQAFLITEDVPAIYIDLGHSRDITYLTDVSVDYLHQPWRVFATIINKCLSGKETGMDKIRLSRAQILWIENKDAKKTNKMSYPRFTKIIINNFMSKDQSNSRRNKMFWHTARDDTMFTSMRCISRHEDTQVYGTILPKELTNQAMLESKAYQTYYAFASREKAPKPNDEEDDDVDNSRDEDDDGDNDADDDNDSNDDDEADSERTESNRDEIPGPNMTNVEQTEQQEEEYSDQRVYTPLDYQLTEEENNDDEEKMDEEEENEVTKELYKDVNINLGSEDKTDGTLESSSVSSDFTSKLLYLDNTPPPILEITSATTVPPPPHFFNPLQHEATPTPTPTTSKATTSTPALLDFASIFKFNKRVTNLETDLSEMKQVDQYAKALSSIPAIVDRYMDNKLREAINKEIQAHNLDCRQNAQDEKNEYIGLVDTSMRTIIREEVTTQLPQLLPQAVSNFATPVIKKNVAESLKDVVLTRSSSQPQSTYEATTTLSEFELTNILIDKMEKNKSYDIDDYKRELYDALVNSYQIDKDLFDSYGKVFSLKRSRDDKDKDQDLSAGSDRGTKRRKSSKEVESSKDSRSKEKKSSKEPGHTIEDSGVQQNQEFDIEILVGPAFNLLKGTCKSITELEYHLEEFSKATTERIDWHNPENKPYPFDLRKPLPLIQDHRGRQIIPKDYFINNDLEYLNGGDLSIRYSNSVTKTKAATYDLKWIKDLVLELWSPVQKYGYGHLEEIEVHRDDQKLYTFREGDFKRLRLQDIEDMLLLLVQQKLTNLTIDERYDLNVALRTYTRRIVIQRQVKDLQLGVESYQKKINLTKTNTYRSNLKNKTAYTSFLDPHGIIYMDQYRRKRLMRADELHKFSDGTLNDVRSALHDIATGIRMESLAMRK